MTSSEIKNNAFKIYNYFIQNNIKIITVESNLYPRYLKNIFLPPVCIYISGKDNFLKKKKIKIHENKNQSVYAFNIQKNILENKDIRDGCLIYKRDFKVIGINLLQDYKCIVNLNTNFNYAIYNSTFANNKIRKNEILSGVVDLLIIPEASYEINLAILVDLMLEIGNNIIVFPNNIFSKNAYFSNYLIKNGALVATNITDIIKYI